MKTEKILSELVIRVKNHFNLTSRDAIAAVCRSPLGNDIHEYGNKDNLTIDELAEIMFRQIANAE